MLHVTAETLASTQIADAEAGAAKVCCADDEGWQSSGLVSYLEEGPHVTAETSRRIACDASIVRLIEDAGGEPLSIGRKSRAIPPAMRRALRARDDGCRFPGCTHRSCVDAHHIEHWADGGETSLGNLVQLCRRHHRLVHEGGFACEKDADGRVTFRDARHQPLGTGVLPVSLPGDATIEDWMVSQMQDVEIDDTTCVPDWMAGETMDWDLAVGHLFTT